MAMVAVMISTNTLLVKCSDEDDELASRYQVEDELEDSLPKPPLFQGGILWRENTRPGNLSAHACKFLGDDTSVDKQGSIQNHNMKIVQFQKQWWSTNTIMETPEVNYQFVGQLNEKINPRLCSWVQTRNDDRTVYNGDTNNVDRFPLLPEFNMPELSCLKANKSTKQYEVIETIKSYPLYGPHGQFLAHNSVSETFPLCGQPDYLDEGQILLLSGSINFGDRTLTCQNGSSTNGINMINLFSMKCQSFPKDKKEET
eukprot:CAMPEP_0197525234 /NCGR_PEP_ID=MMETSP1318-20131121/10703_1 /TAXON_ID=552666 /ORGANISM="Partenskyella glossopodia, Strain RCC365" /LENGTH=256 /DNA_ID=CAMNT_0043078429 /DNA_START=227 /DNA_END=997 /DNA_ORIENTATION=+